jgi:hypothetical protein
MANHTSPSTASHELSREVCPTLIEGPPESNPISDNERESYRTFVEMQRWFKEGTGSPLYEHVAVLLMTWKELDGLKCAEEVGRDMLAIYAVNQILTAVPTGPKGRETLSRFFPLFLANCRARRPVPMRFTASKQYQHFHLRTR